MLLFIIGFEFWSYIYDYVIRFLLLFFSSPINNKIHRPSNVALFYSFSGLLNDKFVFESFLSHHHW